MSTLATIAARHDTDKAVHGHYLAGYERQLAGLRDAPVRLLELGIHRGGSLLMWRDYFARGTIVGLDLAPIELVDPGDRVHVYRGAQDDTRLLDRLAAAHAPDGFDVIIDDCAHVGVLARASFWHLFDHHLKPGGLYVIEDWGTGYWDRWPDGVRYEAGGRGATRRSVGLAGALGKLAKVPGARHVPGVPWAIREVRRRLLARPFASHQAGMVGFVKELVDECAAADITLPGWGHGSPRASRIAEMTVTLGHVFVRKGGAG